MPIDFTTSQWSDISTPPALLEDTLAPISYAPAYELLLRYFFHLNKANERSERMLELTTEILQKNPGHYTIWMARVECLMKMQIEQLRQNLTWLNTLLQDNPKGYQAWHHREWLIAEFSKRNCPISKGDETHFIQLILADDEKNYHCWGYRIWLVQHLNDYDGEMDFIKTMLSFDIRNNSVWNYRHFVIEKTDEWNEEMIAKETDFAMKKITIAPDNESPWNYIRGITSRLKLESLPDLVLFLKRDEYNSNRFALSLLATWHLQQNDEAGAIKIWQQLIELDSIREAYWRHMISSVSPSSIVEI